MKDLTFKQQLLLVAMANPEFIKLARHDKQMYTVESTFANSVNAIVDDIIGMPKS